MDIAILIILIIGNLIAAFSHMAASEFPYRHNNRAMAISLGGLALSLGSMFALVTLGAGVSALGAVLGGVITLSLVSFLLGTMSGGGSEA